MSDYEIVTLEGDGEKIENGGFYIKNLKIKKIEDSGIKLVGDLK